MATNGKTSTFTATIGRSNDTGFQIAERPGQWLNWSKFGPRPTLPSLGTLARITIDARGFVTAIEPLEDEPQAPLPFDDGRRARSVSSAITRLACLKAAARFFAQRDDATPEDVRATAAAWAAWVDAPVSDP